MRITFREIAIVFLGALIAIVFACLGQGAYARYKAGLLKNALAQLEVGKSTERDAKAIFKRFRAENGQIGGRVYDTVALGPEYLTSNRGLSILHIAKPTTYYVGFLISKGIVVRKLAGMRVGDGDECCFWDTEQSTTDFNDLSSFTKPRGVFIHEEEGLAHLSVDKNAPESIANEAFDFNLACLTSVSGCMTMNKALPKFRHSN